MGLVDQNGAEILDHNSKIYAKVETSMFRKTPIDTIELLNNIKKIDNYVSIKEILDEEIASDYPGRKQIYKIKSSAIKETRCDNLEQSKNNS